MRRTKVPNDSRLPTVVSDLNFEPVPSSRHLYFTLGENSGVCSTDFCCKDDLIMCEKNDFFKNFVLFENNIFINLKQIITDSMT
jgi:hypothetical protein